MLRLAYLPFVWMLGIRSWRAEKAYTSAYANWESFVKAMGLKPLANEPVEAKIEYGIKDADARRLAKFAQEAKARSITKANTYAKAKNFLPRSAWSFISYGEIGALILLGGWMAEHYPDTLSRILTGVFAASWKICGACGNAMEWVGTLDAGTLIPASLLTMCIGWIGYCGFQIYKIGRDSRRKSEGYE